MPIPALGPRGEGWVVAQVGLVLLIVIAGLSGSEWSATAAPLRWVVGISVGTAGWVLVVSGVVGLGRSLTPFPKPSERSTLRVGGVYRVVRHPIYGGLILVALGWSLLSSPLALFATAFRGSFLRAEVAARGISVAGTVSRVRRLPATREVAIHTGGALTTVEVGRVTSAED